MTEYVVGSQGYRKAITDAIGPLLPSKKYSIFPTAGGKNAFTKPTILLERSELATLKEAPLSGTFISTYTLLIISHHLIADDPEDFLDDICDEVLEALEDSKIAVWTDAKRVVYNGTNPCYNVTLQSTPTSRQKDGS